MVAAKKSQKQKWERVNYIVKLIAHSIFPKDTCPQLFQPLKYMPPLHKNRCFSQFKKHATFLDQKKTRCFSRLKKNDAFDRIDSSVRGNWEAGEKLTHEISKTRASNSLLIRVSADWWFWFCSLYLNRFLLAQFSHVYVRRDLLFFSCPKTETGFGGRFRTAVHR